MISAKVIADSKNVFGNRITSFELVMPRIILSEFNTHRMISKNSASSRAIKFEKMIKMVLENPFIPIKWIKEHKGMQGYEYFEDEKPLIEKWLQARDEAIIQSKCLSSFGVTKQVCNRLIEPFMYHKVIATGTEWENFFALRNHPDAEIHMQELAKSMLNAMNDSYPKLLYQGEWHIPYGDDITDDLIYNYFIRDYDTRKDGFWGPKEMNEARIKIATSRCAGASYTVIGEDGEVEDYSKLIKRHNKLLSSGHMSPFEHCAYAMSDTERNNNFIRSLDYPETTTQYGWCGNFNGFVQYRKLIIGENKHDNRLLKK